MYIYGFLLYIMDISFMCIDVYLWPAGAAHTYLHSSIFLFHVPRMCARHQGVHLSIDNVYTCLLIMCTLVY